MRWKPDLVDILRTVATCRKRVLWVQQHMGSDVIRLRVGDKVTRVDLRKAPPRGPKLVDWLEAICRRAGL